MLNNINGKDGILNNPLIQQNEVQSIGNRKNATNPYAKTEELFDDSEISKEAIDLYERELDVAKFKRMVLSSLDENDGTSEIIGLVKNGKYQVSDEELADSIMDDFDLLNHLF